MNNIPKILHLYWGLDKPLSWLRWLTVKTFALLNPDWQVIVWRPDCKGKLPNWKTKEHIHSTYNGDDWIEKINEAGPNVEIRIATINDFPLLSEVHRSDLLRWRLLHTIGGFWSDFDIIYFRPMSTLDIDLTVDALLCWGEIDELKNWQAIGFLAGKPGCKLFQEIEKLGLELSRMPNLGYQDLGTFLLSGFAKPWASEAVGSRIGQIPQVTVYPFHWLRGQMDALWKHYGMLDVRDNTIGLHWFAAQLKSCVIEGKWNNFSDVKYERFFGGIKWALQESGLIDLGDEPDIEYSIIIPYFDRSVLLHNTLMSYKHWYSGRNDLEIVIVQDSKCTNPANLYKVINQYQGKGLNIRVVTQEAKDSDGPCILYNRGVRESKGRYVILTSPEVYHDSDIIGGLDFIFDEAPERYVVCACQSRLRPKNFLKINNFSGLRGKPDRWFQHSRFRPSKYHFCSAIRKDLYLKIGGFDERFSQGFCFDDDDFRDTVIEAGIIIEERDDLLTSHQWHKPREILEKMDRWNKNKRLYEKKHGKHKFIETPLIQQQAPVKSIPKHSIQPSVDIFCVLKSGGSFTQEYVVNLRNMIFRNTSIKYRFACLTDMGEIHEIETIQLTNNLPGWWSKIELFRPDISDAERIVYFDLDTLITGNINDLLELNGNFYGLRPWNRRNRLSGQLGSGIMAWKNGDFNFLFDCFEMSKIKSNSVGDQAYISETLANMEINYLPLQNFVSGIYSYKRECRNRLPKDARIICFHGRPRIHDIKDAWAKDAWR